MNFINFWWPTNYIGPLITIVVDVDLLAWTTKQGHSLMLMLYSADVAENSEILFAELLLSLFSLDDKLNVARSVINYSQDMSIISMSMISALIPTS